MIAKTNTPFALLAALALALACSGCGTVYSAARDQRSVGTIADDKGIESAIKYELLRDEIVKGLDIAVYAFRGNVFLVGVIERQIQQSRAVAIAKAQQGVREVQTYLLEKQKASLGRFFDDTAITAGVKAKLIKDTRIKSTQIEVKTILGHVVLLGLTASRQMADLAVAHARSVENVQAVKSFMIVE